MTGKSYAHFSIRTGLETVRRRIVAAAGVPCQLGGGLRSTEHISEALAWGVERVILGTRALEDPGWLDGVGRRWPGKVDLGIDARDGRVATAGWLQVSDVSALLLPLAKVRLQSLADARI